LLGAYFSTPRTSRFCNQCDYCAATAVQS
jgi:hypothetical protein